MCLELFIVFIATFLGTGALNIIFRFLGKRGYMGNLYEPVRGGTPRGIGIIPFIVISLFLPAGYNNLVLVMGLCALVDDVIGVLGQRDDYVIPWNCIRRIGPDIILVDIKPNDCCVPRNRGFWLNYKEKC